MTREEFSQSKFKAGDRAIYDGNEYVVASIDFKEQLIGLLGVIDNSDELTWVRCESVEYLSV